MNIIFWALEIFFVLMGLVCLKAIFHPETHARWTLEKVRSEMKFYAFDGEIKIGGKSAARIRNGHIVMLLIIMLFMAALKIILK